MPRSHGVREAEGSTRPGDIVAGVVVHVVVAVVDGPEGNLVLAAGLEVEGLLAGAEVQVGQAGREPLEPTFSASTRVPLLSSRYSGSAKLAG